MVRCLFCSLLLLGAAGSLCAESRFDPVAGKSPADLKEEAALKEMILAQKYRDFEAALLRLAQRLERSSKPEEREKGTLVRKALETAGKVGISTRFHKLIDLLNDP